jgi:uncharacterized protein involved in tolerance to divalent cations
VDHVTITSFTIDRHRDEIIAEVMRSSVEEVPMVVFTAMDGNDELLRWIEGTVQ